MKRVVRILALIVGGLVLLCGVAGALSALSNRNLPTGPEVLDHLDEAEQAHSRGEAYWAADAQMHAEWQQEIALLAQALEAESDEDAATLVRQFLAQREQRRAAHDLDAALTDYERALEWEEGIEVRGTGYLARGAHHASV